jgi:RNA polymerase sigma-70 factor (ECF subfamily)
VIPDQDLKLMALVSEGDLSAQRAVVRRLLQRAQRLAVSLLGRGADASDASQASLVEILRCAGEFRGESSLERWADRIVARTALRFARRERRARGADIGDHLERAVSPLGEDSLMVQQYLDQLSAPQRSAIVLRHVFEYSVEEIADLTGVSPNTVKDRLLRGREQIRRLIRREDAIHMSSGSGRYS